MEQFLTEEEQFFMDLKRGHAGEAKAAEILISTGCTYTDVTNNKYYAKRDIDFVVTTAKGNTHTVEVKNDEKSAVTGNFFIEYQNDKNKYHNYAGWYHYCEAEFLAILHNDELYMIPFAALQEIIDNTPLRTAYSNNSAGYLLPISLLKEKCDNLVILKEEK